MSIEATTRVIFYEQPSLGLEVSERPEVAELLSLRKAFAAWGVAGMGIVARDLEHAGGLGRRLKDHDEPVDVVSLGRSFSAHCYPNIGAAAFRPRRDHQLHESGRLAIISPGRGGDPRETLCAAAGMYAFAWSPATVETLVACPTESPMVYDADDYPLAMLPILNFVQKPEGYTVPEHPLLTLEQLGRFNAEGVGVALYAPDSPQSPTLLLPGIGPPTYAV